MKRIDWFAYKRTKKRKLEDHLSTMQMELNARLNAEHKFVYGKGIAYYRDQIKKTKQLLGIK